MSQENVKLLQGAMGHFIRTGEPLWDVIHPDVEVHDHDILDAGQYRGHSGYARWLRDWGSAWESFSATPERYIDAGDKVVVELSIRATGAGSGVEVQRRDAIVFEIADGLTTRLDYFNDPAQALEAVGLAP